VNPSPTQFESLIQKRTLKIIYQKFSKRYFTTQEAVTQFYWLGCIEEHVQYMQERGWISLDDGLFRFVVRMEDWSFEEDVY